MARDGSGNYARVRGPYVNGTIADGDHVDDEFDDIKDALTTSWNTSGTKTTGANQPMGGFKFTGLGAGSSNGDSVRYEQLTALSSVYQPLDAMLTAIAGLTSADDRMLDFTGADAVAVVTYATVLSNIGAQASDSDLTALAGNSTNGIWARTGSGTGSARTITAGAGISVSDGDGVSGNPTITADFATVAEIRANTANQVVGTDEAWDSVTAVALTDAATIAVDFSAGINFSVTLGGNRTLGQPSNQKVGQSGFIRITQDGTGTRTLAYHADWKFAGGTDPTLSTPAATVDVLFYQVVAANSVLGALVKAIA